MKNFWLVLLQFGLSFGSFVTGVWLSDILFGDDLSAIVSCGLFLFTFLMPFLWYSSLVIEKEKVDRVFVLEQVIWHLYLFAVSYKLGWLSTDKVTVGLLLVLVYFVFRQVTHNSFLKLER